MPIAFRCSNAECAKPLKVKDELAGKKIKCSACGKVVPVPAATNGSTQKEAPAKAAGPKKAPDKSKATGAKPAAAKASTKKADLTPLEESWQESPLLKMKAIVVRQKIWTRKYGPDFNLFAPGADDNAGEANNRPGLVAVLLGLANMHDFVPKWMEISDENGTLFCLKIVKLVNNRYDIYDPSRKELLASIKTVFSTEVALRILDTEGNDNGEVVASQLPGVGKQSYFGYSIKTADGAKMGDFTNEANDYFRRTGKRSFSGGKGYVGTVAPEFANDPKAKVIVLAATLAARIEDLGVHEFDPMKA